MTEEVQILVGILAVGDATWLPIRLPFSKARSIILDGQKSFRSHGVPYASGAISEAARKEFQRLSESLVADGKIRTYRGRDELRTTFVALEAAAEAEVRALCGLPSLADSVAMLRDLARRSDRAPKLLHRKWIGEDEITGVRWGGDTHDYVILEELFLPCLRAGWCVSGSDIQGHVRYAMTPAGWAITDSVPAVHQADHCDDEEARSAYYAKIKEAFARWERGTGANVREIGPLPLPVSIVDVPILE